MKGYVFIGWSKDQELAKLVKSKLDKHGYRCIIGGNHENNPQNVLFKGGTVNATVCNQMNRCSYAIMLLVKRERNDVKEDAYKYEITSNIFFEWGYLSSRFSGSDLLRKMFIFAIDIDDSEKSLLFPSDLEGSWMRPLKTSDFDTMDALAQRVVDEFLKTQNSIYDVDDLQFFNNPYLIEYAIDIHFTRPLATDYDFAQYLLYYVQISFIYHRIAEAKKKLVDFRRELKNQVVICDALLSAVDYALLTFDLFEKIKPSDEGKIAMSPKTYREIRRRYIEIIGKYFTVKGNSVINTLEKEEDKLSNSFLGILLAQLQHHMTFLALVFLENPDISDNERADVCKEAIETSLACVENLKWLKLKNLSEKYDDFYYDIFLAYTYRNLKVFFSNTGEETKAKIYDELSIVTRKNLYNQIRDDDSVNEVIKRYFALEYYVQVCDVIETYPSYEIEDYLSDIKEFLDIVDKDDNNRNATVNLLRSKYQKLEEKYLK